MSLLGLLDYEGSSSSSSESEEDSEECVDSEKVNKVENISENDTKLDLPSPFLEAKTSSNARDCQQSSVFYNPFKAEEKKKLDVLEKHVQLSNAAPPSKKTNTRICYKFQKGKCRFGDKCRFAHVASNRKTTNKDINIDLNASNEDETNDNKPKKRKIGVSDSLVPPKRAMKAFNELKEKHST